MEDITRISVAMGSSAGTLWFCMSGACNLSNVPPLSRHMPTLCSGEGCGAASYSYRKSTAQCSAAFLLEVQIAGFFAALASVLVSTVRSSSESASFRVRDVPHDAVELPYRPDFFHVVFTLASAYLVRSPFNRSQTRQLCEP